MAHCRDIQHFKIDGATWQDNCEAKAQLTEMYYQHFLKHTYPLMKHLKNREVYIVFESKMNFWENEEPELVDEIFLNELITDNENDSTHEHKY